MEQKKRANCWGAGWVAQTIWDRILPLHIPNEVNGIVIEPEA